MIYFILIKSYKWLSMLGFDCASQTGLEGGENAKEPSKES